MTTTFTLNAVNLEREIDKTIFVVDDVITQLQQVKAVLQQRIHERISGRPYKR